MSSRLSFYACINHECGHVVYFPSGEKKPLSCVACCRSDMRQFSFLGSFPVSELENVIEWLHENGHSTSGTVLLDR